MVCGPHAPPFAPWCGGGVGKAGSVPEPGVRVWVPSIIFKPLGVLCALAPSEGEDEAYKNLGGAASSKRRGLSLPSVLWSRQIERGDRSPVDRALYSQEDRSPQQGPGLYQSFHWQEQQEFAQEPTESADSGKY